MLGSQYRVEKQEPISRRVYRNLRRAILQLDIAPQARIVENAVAQAMGVSRTPVREALSRLETDGLVALLPGGGYVVNDIRQDLEDVYHFRQAVEGYTARLAATNATAEDLARLRGNVQSSQGLRLPQIKERARANAEYHRLLTEASRSPRLIRTIANMRDFAFNEDSMRRHTEADMRAFLDDHAAILVAVEARDGDAAERVTRRHLARALDLVLRTTGRAAS